MKKIKILFLGLLFLPTFTPAAFNDVTLTTSTNISVCGSNPLLGEKQVSASAPDLDSFLANSPLDSRRNLGVLASKKPFSSFKVPRAGIEPAWPFGRQILSL
jgi:hypothetical protein